MPTREGVVESSLDLYSRDAIVDPATAYRALRDAGPVVWLKPQRVLAIGRYEDVRGVLRDPETFVSSKGVTLNRFLNRAAKVSDTVLVSDGEKHDRLRRVLMDPMRPREIERIRPQLAESISKRVESLVDDGEFEAMEKLASHLPVSIVAELVGLQGASRERMVSWSKATFNMIGPMNGRAWRSLPAVARMFRTQQGLRREDVAKGSWIDRLFSLRDAGEIRDSEASGMVIDYIAPSLDTTIFASGHLLARLARHKEAWAALKADPTRVPGAVSESLRIDSVVRAFTRVASRDVELSGAKLRKGDRILVVFGSANRDERRYAEPDRFDVERDARDHLAFGHGTHACAGSRLAHMELESLLGALLQSVDRIEARPPVYALNNTLHGFERLPLNLFRERLRPSH